MAVEYTEIEISALDEKSEFPEKNVKCPRCGKLLQFSESGNSYEVKCPTDGCLKIICRGL